jgi:Cdc6-like AAA superfamily ATPase
MRTDAIAQEVDKDYRMIDLTGFGAARETDHEVRETINENAKFERLAQVARAFSPSAPIDRRAFAGREAQITDIVNACTQRGQHVIIFGERGAGKTSLANALVHMLGTRFLTLACGSINCDQTTTFASLWKAIFSEIAVSKTVSPLGFKTGANLEGTLAQFLPENVTPDAVRAILQKRERLLIIIDEIDRIKDKTTTTLLADTIKSLSDHSADVTLVLVGVAESVDTLIAEHESVQRALIQVQMPRMSHAELDQIVENGVQAVRMTIEPTARQRIIKLSQGLPHYTHLLGMHAAQSAVLADRSHITVEDTHEALEKALKHAQQSVGHDYHRATTSSRETRYPQVLLACALADTDQHGYFTAGDVVTPLSVIMQKQCETSSFSQHLNGLCEERRGPALQRIGNPRAYKYKFRNAILRPYVIMKALQGGLISEERMTQLAA